MFMKINQTQMSELMKNYRQQEVNKSKKAQNQENSSTARQQDSSQISEQAKVLAQSVQKLKNIPDVREEKVEQVKRDIDAGTYQVSGRDIADKMIEESRLNRRV